MDFECNSLVQLSTFSGKALICFVKLFKVNSFKILNSLKILAGLMTKSFIPTALEDTLWAHSMPLTR